jgi:hypothetical protein
MRGQEMDLDCIGCTGTDPQGLDLLSADRLHWIRVEWKAYGKCAVAAHDKEWAGMVAGTTGNAALVMQGI